MPDYFALSTARVAKLAGVEKHVILTAWQRDGRWRGVVPRRQPNRHLLWPSVDVYRALGMVPLGDRTPAARLREHICGRVSADPFHVHLACEALMSGAPHGDTPAQRFASVKTDLALLETLIHRAADRVGSAMNDEEDATDDDWRDFNGLARRLQNAVEHVARLLQWQTVA